MNRFSALHRGVEPASEEINGAVAVVRINLQVRERRMKTGQDGGHATNAKGQRKRDPDAAGDSVRVRGNGLPGIGDIQQNASPPLHKLTCSIGRSNAAGAAIDQLRSEVSLNSCDASTN